MNSADCAMMPGRQERQVRHVAGVDHVQPGERLPEDQQPQRGLHHPGEQLGAVVAQLLQFDDRESAHPHGHSADATPPARRPDNIYLRVVIN